MQLSSLVVTLALASIPVVQGATCAQQSTVDSCLSSASLLKDGCSSDDSKCLCTAYTAIWGCYNPCPSDTDRASAQQSMTANCKASSATTAASTFTTSTTQTASSASSASTTSTKNSSNDSGNQNLNSAQSTTTAVTSVHSATPTPSPTAAPSSASSKALTARIGISIALGSIAVLCILFFLFGRHRKDRRTKAMMINTMNELNMKKDADIEAVKVTPRDRFELPGNQRFYVKEIDGTEVQVTPSAAQRQSRYHPPVELPGESAHGMPTRGLI